MNILGIKTFLAIVENNSLNKAADKLFLSQSTISYRLNELEQEIGVQLIAREQGKRNITLTKEGEEFVQLAQRWISLEKDTSDWKNRESKKLSLSIASVDSINAFIFPSLYKEIKSTENSIALNVSSHWSFTVFGLLKNYDVDVGLVVGLSNFSNIITTPIFSEKLVLVSFNTKNEFNASINIHPHSLNLENEIYVNWGTGYVNWHDYWWDPTHPKFLVVDTAALVKEFLKLANYWSIVPLSIALSFRETIGIKIFELAEPKPRRICYLLKHRHPKLSVIEPLKIFEDNLYRFVENCNYLDAIEVE